MRCAIVGLGPGLACTRAAPDAGGTGHEQRTVHPDHRFHRAITAFACRERPEVERRTVASCARRNSAICYWYPCTEVLTGGPSGRPGSPTPDHLVSVRIDLFRIDWLGRGADVRRSQERRLLCTHPRRSRRGLHLPIRDVQLSQDPDVLMPALLRSAWLRSARRRPFAAVGRRRGRDRVCHTCRRSVGLGRPSGEALSRACGRRCRPDRH